MSDNHRQTKLLERACEGDVEAFADLFEALRPTVYAIAYRLVGPNDADDVTMETYLKAWKAIPRFNRRASLKTWLYRITHNCAMDFHRSRQRSREVLLREDENDSRTISELWDERAPAPSEISAERERRAELHRAVRELDPVHRTTILLRYADELSYAEIAAATDVSIGTVMSRLFNAKRKLRRLLREASE